MKLSGTSLRAGLASLSLSVGLCAVAYVTYRTWQMMDGPMCAAMAALEALPDPAPDAQAWIAAYPNWAVAQEAAQPLPDLPGYRLRTVQLKPRTGVAVGEWVALVVAGEQAAPAWRVQELDLRSVGPAKMDVGRLVFSRVERSAR